MTGQVRSTSRVIVREEPHETFSNRVRNEPLLRMSIGAWLYKREAISRASPGWSSTVDFLSGLPIHPPHLPTSALHGPHSFSFTVTKSPRKEALSLDVERRLPGCSAGPGPEPGVGAVRRTASGP